MWGIVLAMLLFIGESQTAYAASVTVTTTDDELNADGDCSLREAIEAANTDAAVDACPAGSGPDTIVVPPGTYVLTLVGAGEDANATGDLDIANDITILGDGAATTIVDGWGLDLVLTIHAGQAQITGLTIRNGVGGMDNWSDLTLTGVTVEGNAAEHGAGIRNGGRLSLQNSAVTGNSAIYKGGAIFNDPTGNITIQDSTVSGNTALNSAGIHNEGTLTIIDSTLNENMTALTGLGGGIGNIGSLTITGGIFSGNSAENGAAIFNVGNMSIADSSFIGNTATCCGGAVSVESGTAIIGNSTFSANSAGDGGAIGNGGKLTLTDVTLINNMAGYGGGVSSSGTLAIMRSTFTGNTATYGGGGIHNRSGWVTVDRSTITGNSAMFGGGIDNSEGSTPGIINITASQLSDNTASQDGGAISNTTGTVTLDGSKVTRNTASRGGGIYNDDSLSLTNTAVTRNSATPGPGGGIFNDGGTLSLTKSKVHGNKPDDCVGC